MSHVTYMKDSWQDFYAACHTHDWVCMGAYGRGSNQGVDQLLNEFPATFKRVSCNFQTSFLRLSDEFLANRTQKNPRNDPEKAKCWRVVG